MASTSMANSSGFYGGGGSDRYDVSHPSCSRMGLFSRTLKLGGLVLVAAALLSPPAALAAKPDAVAAAHHNHYAAHNSHHHHATHNHPTRSAPRAAAAAPSPAGGRRARAPAAGRPAWSRAARTKPVAAARDRSFVADAFPYLDGLLTSARGAAARAVGGGSGPDASSPAATGEVWEDDADSGDELDDEPESDESPAVTLLRDALSYVGGMFGRTTGSANDEYGGDEYGDGEAGELDGDGQKPSFFGSAASYLTGLFSGGASDAESDAEGGQGDDVDDETDGGGGGWMGSAYSKFRSLLDGGTGAAAGGSLRPGDEDASADQYDDETAEMAASPAGPTDRFELLSSLFNLFADANGYSDARDRAGASDEPADDDDGDDGDRLLSRLIAALGQSLAANADGDALAPEAAGLPLGEVLESIGIDTDSVTEDEAAQLMDLLQALGEQAEQSEGDLQGYLQRNQAGRRTPAAFDVYDNEDEGVDRGESVVGELVREILTKPSTKPLTSRQQFAQRSVEQPTKMNSLLDLLSDAWIRQDEDQVVIQEPDGFFVDDLEGHKPPRPQTKRQRDSPVAAADKRGKRQDARGLGDAPRKQAAYQELHRKHLSGGSKTDSRRHHHHDNQHGHRYHQQQHQDPQRDGDTLFDMLGSLIDPEAKSDKPLTSRQQLAQRSVANPSKMNSVFDLFSDAWIDQNKVVPQVVDGFLVDDLAPTDHHHHSQPLSSQASPPQQQQQAPKRAKKHSQRRAAPPPAFDPEDVSAGGSNRGGGGGGLWDFIRAATAAAAPPQSAVGEKPLTARQQLAQRDPRAPARMNSLLDLLSSAWIGQAGDTAADAVVTQDPDGFLVDGFGGAGGGGRQRRRARSAAAPTRAEAPAGVDGDEDDDGSLDVLGRLRAFFGGGDSALASKPTKPLTARQQLAQRSVQDPARMNSIIDLLSDAWIRQDAAKVVTQDPDGFLVDDLEPARRAAGGSDSAAARRSSAYAGGGGNGGGGGVLGFLRKLGEVIAEGRDAPASPPPHVAQQQYPAAAATAGKARDGTGSGGSSGGGTLRDQVPSKPLTAPQQLVQRSVEQPGKMNSIVDLLSDAWIRQDEARVVTQDPRGFFVDDIGGGGAPTPAAAAEPATTRHRLSAAELRAKVDQIRRRAAAVKSASASTPPLAKAKTARPPSSAKKEMLAVFKRALRKSKKAKREGGGAASVAA
ncbi:hypothetical protein DFJ73DRAFT_799874 [Zopfochytrium polystomum]|nr:hypothetical protein DFJ73DRAFT_799874 [Zopfochytrium polystomum]